MPVDGSAQQSFPWWYNGLIIIISKTMKFLLIVLLTLDLKSLILGLASSLDKLVAKLLRGFFGESRQTAFRANASCAIAAYCRACPCGLNIKVREAKNASQDATVDVHVLNAVVRNGYILFIYDPKFLAKTGVCEFVAVKVIGEFCPDET